MTYKPMDLSAEPHDGLDAGRLGRGAGLDNPKGPILSNTALGIILAVGFSGALIVLVITPSTSSSPAPIATAAVTAPPVTSAPWPPPKPPPAEIRATQGEVQANRRAYAKASQEFLWRSGMEATMETRGPKDTTLYVKYVLAGDAWRFQFTENFVRPSADSLRQMGFKKITLTDGYDYSWVWNL